MTLAGLPQTQTLIFSPGPSDGKCALVRTDFANVPFGTTPDFTSNAWTVSGTPVSLRSLIYFDLTPIPANAIIISATLSLYCNITSGYSQLQYGDNQSNLLVITQDWDKSLVTWNYQPSTTALNSVYLPSSTSNTQDYPSIDVKVPVMQMIANPASNFGWMIRLLTEQLYRSMVFASSSHPNTNWRPTLTVTFCLPTGEAGTIIGPESVCQGDMGKVYTVPPVANATYYVWNIPPGATITNGANTNSITVSYSAGAISGNITVYGSDLCSTGIPSPPFPVAVNASVSVDVSVSGSANNICAGTAVTFTAFPTNGGTLPQYQWKVNAVNVINATNAVYTYTPVNGDQVTCELTSDAPCSSNNTATSNIITMIVDPLLPVTISISPSANPVCAGATVTLTATTGNEGVTPVYNWKVNGGNAGTGLSTYTYIPAPGDLVSCILTSSNTTCVSNNPASSNTVTMGVDPNMAVNVTIAAVPNPYCTGDAVTITATPDHGGLTPVYLWKVNDIDMTATGPVYTYIPVNGDQVRCYMTSSLQCITNNPATSTTVVLTENSNFPASVNVTTTANPFCPGTSVTYTAWPTNGGTLPSYQWKVNGVSAASNLPTYTYLPLPGDSIRCIMTSNLYCVTASPTSSSKIIMSALPLPVVSFTTCFDTITTLNAKPFKLHGGLPYGGTYAGPGVNSTTGVFTPSLAGTGLKTINYSYTNVTLCSAGKNKTIAVQANPAFNCGGNLTDIRDNKVYPTVQIGTQCWMASNLDYGTEIPESQHQQDNCLPEKYSHTSATSAKYSYYQWGEIMNYDATPGFQGLCPPGWHVPDESEWTILINYYQGNSKAGYPLQDTYLNGFRALQSGVYYLNTTCSFPGFAEIFWSSTQADQVRAWSHGMNTTNLSVSLYAGLKANGFSVRCLHD